MWRPLSGARDVQKRDAQSGLCFDHWGGARGGRDVSGASVYFLHE